MVIYNKTVHMYKLTNSEAKKVKYIICMLTMSVNESVLTKGELNYVSQLQIELNFNRLKNCKMTNYNKIFTEKKAVSMEKF